MLFQVSTKLKCGGVAFTRVLVLLAMPVEENNKILTIAANQLRNNNLPRPYKLVNLNLQEILDSPRYQLAGKGRSGNKRKALNNSIGTFQCNNRANPEKNGFVQKNKHSLQCRATEPIIVYSIEVNILEDRNFSICLSPSIFMKLDKFLISVVHYF